MGKQTFGKLDSNDLGLLEKLQGFIPDAVFDAHAHLHHVDHMPEGNNLFRILGTADVGRMQRDQKVIYGDRKFHALLLPTPSILFRDRPELRDEVNKWMIAELEKAPNCVGAVYVMPGDTVEKIETMLTNDRIKGFKCYHLTAKTDGSTYLADIGDYLPESAWEVANEYGMSITLHMVKPLALADHDNMEYIKSMTAKYPNAKLILAHCARGFAPWTTIETVRQLKGIPNIYYDMAAICDPATMVEVIRQAGCDHVMWGSDYVIDRVHGKPVACGKEFRWLYNHELPAEVDFPASLTIIESLFSFYQASLILDLTKEEIAKVFYGTGCQLFGLEA